MRGACGLLGVCSSGRERTMRCNAERGEGEGEGERGTSGCVMMIASVRRRVRCTGDDERDASDQKTRNKERVSSKPGETTRDRPGIPPQQQPSPLRPCVPVDDLRGPRSCSDRDELREAALDVDVLLPRQSSAEVHPKGPPRAAVQQRTRHQASADVPCARDARRRGARKPGRGADD